MAEEQLNIDDCVDVVSIRAKFKEPRLMLQYPNDFAPRISEAIYELETRLVKLGKDPDQ